MEPRALFLLGALLALLPRLSAFFALRGLPFWFDEVWTAQFATFPSSFLAVVERVAREDLHPPLGYLAYKAWALLLGVRDPVVAPPPEGHEDLLRLLPLLAGSLGGGFIALALRALGARPAFALLGAALFGVVPGALSVGLEVRQYGLLLLLFPLLLWAWAEGRWRLFGAAGALALYTHYLSLPLLLGLALRREARRPVLLALLFFLPWALFAFSLQRKTSAASAVLSALSSPGFVSTLAWALAELGGAPIAALLLLALGALGLLVGRGPLLHHLPLLAAFFLLSSASPRYGVLLVPFVALGAGLLLEAAGRRFPKAPVFPLALALLALYAAFALPKALEARVNTASMGLAAAFIGSVPGERAYAWNSSAGYTLRYYDRKKEVRLVPPEPPEEPGFLLAPAPSLLASPGLRHAPSWAREAQPVYVPGGWAVYLWGGKGRGGR